MNHEKNHHLELPMDVVYMFHVDGKGDEIGEPVAIGLHENGSADLSGIPSALRETWETVGVRTLVGFGNVKPEQGESFLRALLQSTNGYQRFRRSPDHV